MKCQLVTQVSQIVGLCLLTSGFAPYFNEVVGQEELPINVAATSQLPSGQGIAVSYQNDQKIIEHSDVIFAEDFEPGNFEALGRNSKSR